MNEYPIEPPVESSQLDFTTAAQLAGNIQAEIQKVVFGQDETITQSIAALFSGGHVLLEGKPGLGKTQTLSSSGSLHRQGSRLRPANHIFPGASRQ